MNNVALNSIPYASFGKRFVASLVDGLILFIPCMITGRLIPVIGGLVILFLYEPVLVSSEIRATIGKRLMGIQITTLNGGRVSFRTANIRQLMKFVSSFSLMIGYLLALFTEKKQTLHDLVAETIAVQGTSTLPVVDAWLDNLKMIRGPRPATPPSAPASPPTSTPDSRFPAESTITQLERLQRLRDQGVLNEAEFAEEKKKILG